MEIHSCCVGVYLLYVLTRPDIIGEKMTNVRYGPHHMTICGDQKVLIDVSSQLLFRIRIQKHLRKTISKINTGQELFRIRGEKMYKFVLVKNTNILHGYCRQRSDSCNRDLMGSSVIHAKGESRKNYLLSPSCNT